MKLPKSWINPANGVTIARVILLLVVVLLIRTPDPLLRAVCIAMVPAIFYLDCLDGYLARHHRCASRLGSVLDIAGDRIVESVLWILLGFLQIVPIWIPIVVLVRAFLTDGLRSVAISGGQTPFSIMKSRLGWWVVASPISRTTYAILKAVVFTLGLMLWSYSLPAEPLIQALFVVLLTLVVAQCLLRSVYSIRDCLHVLAEG